MSSPPENDGPGIGEDAAVAALPTMPRDEDGPVFAAPWQAQAFAMTVELHRRGLFEWSEWAERLGAELAAAGPNDSADDYYGHWLHALEKLVVDKRAIGEDERIACIDAWDRAATSTPHGQPIVLGSGVPAGGAGQVRTERRPGF